MKDTPENRQLQKDLAEKAQLQLYAIPHVLFNNVQLFILHFRGAYLYRRERKKHSHKTSERINSSEDGSSGSPARMDTEDNTSSSEDDSSLDEDTIPIELTPYLQEMLEQDYYFINNSNKVFI